MLTISSKSVVPVLLAGLLATAMACSDDDPAPASPSTTSDAGGNNQADASSDASTAKDIVDTAVAAGSFKTLVSAVQAAGLEATLRGPGPLTVFAPSDAAFAKVPDFLLTKLVSAPYKTELGLILEYHVLPGDVKAASVLGKTQEVASVGGGKLQVDGSNGKVVINGSANVTTADVAASNGTIHAIDSVLLPTIVDTAVAYDDGTTKFSSLVAAVTAADLVGTLSGPGPYTVFAPTDAAFAALKAELGDAAFNAVLADKPKLTKILTYHVLSSTVYAKDVAAGEVTTVESSKLTIATEGGVKISDSTATAANVVLTDLPNRNGVIHVIDKVLLPPGL